MKIAIIEENQFVRQALSHVVQNITDQKNLLGAESLIQLMETYPKADPEIILKIVGQSESFEQVITQFVHKARILFPDSRIILFSGDLRRYTIHRYLVNGVKGYLDKTADVAELAACIKKVMRGGVYLNVDVIYKVLVENGNSQHRGGPKSRKI